MTLWVIGRRLSPPPDGKREKKFPAEPRDAASHPNPLSIEWREGEE